MLALLIFLGLLLVPVQSYSEVETEWTGSKPNQQVSIHDESSHGRVKRESLDIEDTFIIESRRKLYSYIRTAIDELSEQQRDENILIHTQYGTQDVIIFNHTVMNISAEKYTKFMALSHLPVLAVTIILPDLMKNDPLANLSPNTSKRLQELQELREKWSASGQFNEEETKVSTSIINDVSVFINDLLNNSKKINMEYLKRFAEGLQLKQAARFAVKDYFSKLNEVIDDKLQDVDMVVVMLHPGSFLVKYYKQKIKSQPRIILLPQTSDDTFGEDVDTIIRTALSNDTLIRNLSGLFNDNNDAGLHNLLSEAADNIICSSELNFTAPANCNPINLIGFQTNTERAYVILIVTFISTTIVFLIIVLSVYCEDRLMKMENRPTESEKEVVETQSQGPSLMAPMKEQEFTTSYAAYRQLKKRHTAPLDDSKLIPITEEATSDGTKQLLSTRTTSRRGFMRLSDTGSLDDASSDISGGFASKQHAHEVSCTEISLVDTTKS